MTLIIIFMICTNLLTKLNVSLVSGEDTCNINEHVFIKY